MIWYWIVNKKDILDRKKATIRVRFPSDLYLEHYFNTGTTLRTVNGTITSRSELEKTNLSSFL